MQYKAIEIKGWSPDLPEAMSDIGYEWTFTIDEPSVLKVSGHIDCHHRGVYGTAHKAVMVAFRAMVNKKMVRGSKTGCNIVNTAQHYAIVPIHGYHELEPGTYTVKMQGRSASTAAKGKNGLAEIKGGYNQVVYEVFPQ